MICKGWNTFFETEEERFKQNSFCISNEYQGTINQMMWYRFEVKRNLDVKESGEEVASFKESMFQNLQILMAA